MIELVGFGPGLGRPDPSPFVVKTEVLLKMSGLAYRVVRGNPMSGPKKKLPVIRDQGAVIADSTFIRHHLERRSGIDFDKGLNARERATAWAFQILLEEHFYWVAVYQRWVPQANFDRGMATLFGAIPFPIRWLVKLMIRRSVIKSLWCHGMGRHSPAEILAFGAADIKALSALLGDKPFMMADHPTSLDAVAFAMLWQVGAGGAMPELFQLLKSEPALAAYVERMQNLYYSGFKS